MTTAEPQFYDPNPDDPGIEVPDTKKGLAIAALVVSILSLCSWCVVYCGGPLSIAGLILGILGLKSPSGKTMAIIAIVISCLSILLTIAFFIFGIVTSMGVTVFDVMNDLNF